MLAKMTEMEIDERFTALEWTVQRTGLFEEKMEEMKRLWEENVERLERLWTKKEKSIGISEEKAQSKEIITSQIEKPMSSDDPSTFAMDQVMDRSPQCVRNLTPLVVEQQPERNTVKF